MFLLNSSLTVFSLDSASINVVKIYNKADKKYVDIGGL